MSSMWTCGACGTGNADRASCLACATSSPTATPDTLAATALLDAADARAAQLDEASRGNHDLAQSLTPVIDMHLDDALALRSLGTCHHDPQKG
ncbi:hypothetical protein [Streptomyces justiciae]|uniref:hypothetical protein n=1 Tax=Streptomyces justiciae TaxID=2780140 RepID=UPI002119587C|nr:hypothetical protein [Streptomyces justiciae]MCW8383967.1 hypothetical protein [Streptomyces justiciae]